MLRGDERTYLQGASYPPLEGGGGKGKRGGKKRKEVKGGDSKGENFFSKRLGCSKAGENASMLRDRKRKEKKREMEKKRKSNRGSHARPWGWKKQVKGRRAQGGGGPEGRRVT